MRSVSKANGAGNHRASRAGRSTATMRASHRRKPRIDENPERAALREPWELAPEEDLDLDDLDLETLEADDGDTMDTDWLADRDFALAIAQRALH